MNNNTLLEKISVRDLNRYIKLSNNVKFANNSLVLQSCNSNICLDFKDTKVNFCILKIKRDSGNGIVTITSNNSNNTHNLYTKAIQSLHCVIGTDSLLTISRGKLSKGDVSIHEILIYGDEKSLNKDNEVDNYIYNSNKVGFEEVNSNSAVIDSNGVSINNKGSYTVHINNLEIGKRYFVKIDAKNINGNGKFNIDILDNSVLNTVVKETVQAYYLDFVCTSKSTIVSLNRPRASKGVINISEIIISDKSIKVEDCNKDCIENQQITLEESESTTFNNVVFFNFWNNGDVHVSRSFVKFINGLGYPCEYLHNNSKNLLADIDINCTSIDHGMKNYNVKLNCNTKTRIINNVLFINTWYGADQNIFAKYGINFDCLYYYFKEVISKYFNIDISIYDIWNFFPEIDFNNFNTVSCADFLEKYKVNKKIFISNGDVKSSQIENFNFSPIINVLSHYYPDYIFLLSDQKNDITNNSNVFFTQNIISSQECDLNENSYLSMNCNMIVGRNSGAYTYAITKSNYQRECKFINFTNDLSIKLYNLSLDMQPNWIKELPLNYKAKFIGSEENRIKRIYNILNKHIELLQESP